MSSTKVIVILGATGNQGGSVADTFFEKPGWQIRALTRNTSSAKAHALAKRGAQVVTADIDNPETLPAAFEGAHAVFAVSNFWALYGDPANQGKNKPGQPLNVWAAEHETRQLKNVIDAVAKVPTLERFVLSSLSNSTKWSKGKYTRVYHFDSKAKAEDYGKATYPDLWRKTSVFQAGIFLSNFISNYFFKATKNEEGTVQFKGNLVADVKFPFIAPEEDTGPIVEALITEPAGKNVVGYREWLTLGEVVTLPLGEFHVPIPDDLKPELSDNSGYWNEFGYEGRDEPTITHPSNLETPLSLGTVEGYFKKQDWDQVFSS
ncbi:hypothetical protein S40288_10300 [Stachybotrys chartarum IBT 40288]|nr:hypothetical protein S40288_10300 [Stachybotrys chartarum IBT 40288]